MNITLYKKNMLSTLLLLCSITAYSYDFEVDGIYYEVTSITDIEVAVTYATSNYNSYSGDIIVPSTVTYNNRTLDVIGIGDSAFFNCTGLTSIDIPNSVTSIGKSAFYGCSNLTSVTIPNVTTSIGKSAFSRCSSLTSLTLPVSASYTTYYASEDYSSFPNTITDLTITGEGELVNYAFYGCSKLKNVTLSSGITRIGSYAFYVCSSLTSVTIPDATTSIGDCAFCGCSSLTCVTIGKGVTSIGVNAFSGCSNLTSVTIPDATTRIGEYAFSFCSSLTSITIPDATTSIGNYAFWTCSSLTSVTIGKGVKSIGKSAFSRCSSLTSLTFPVSASFETTQSSSPSFPNIQTTLTDLTITGEGDLQAYAFYGCSKLKNVTLSSGITSIGSYAFGECDLTSIHCLSDTPCKIYLTTFSNYSYLNASVNYPQEVYLPINLQKTGATSGIFLKRITFQA